ncbi:MAG: hypothetical protein ACRDCH_03195 [Metamycoplasmataceae bacterium]
MNQNTQQTNKKISLLAISIIGAILSILAFGLFALVATGTTLIILDSFKTFWVPILIACSIIFLVACVVNILLYARVILNKNSYILKDENEFPFWTSAIIFWVLPIFSWAIFIALHFKETKGLI